MLKTPQNANCISAIKRHFKNRILTVKYVADFPKNWE